MTFLHTRRHAGRRLISTGVLVAVGLAMLLPATASAALPLYRIQLTRSACTSADGQYGFGKVVLGVRALTYNSFDSEPSPNYIVFRTKRQEKIDGSWVTASTTVRQSPVYPDNYFDSIIDSTKTIYSFPGAEHPRTRLLTRIEFWDDQAHDVLLAAYRRRTDGC